MSEHRGWNDHLRVITSFEYLQVRSTSEGRLNLHPHLARFERSNRDFFHPNIFFAIQHGRFHAARLITLANRKCTNGFSREPAFVSSIVEVPTRFLLKFLSSRRPFVRCSIETNHKRLSKKGNMSTKAKSKAAKKSKTPASIVWFEIPADNPGRDRKSTRLNSSHLGISYAVFC